MLDTFLFRSLGREESTLRERLTEVDQEGCGLDLDESKANIVISELLVAEVLAAKATHERGKLLVLLHLLAHALDLLGHSSEPLRHPQARKPYQQGHRDSWGG